MNEKLIKFTLPSPDSAPLSADPKELPGSDSSKARILVAEDDPISRTLIATRLSKWGYEVVVTNDGNEAMAVFRRPKPPLLAILDWAMPDMDGLEVCRRLRAAGAMVHIILLTAHGTKENIIEGLRAGADDYLVKPFHAEELQARILVGLRAMTSQERLAARLRALEVSASDFGALRPGIPI